MNAKIIRAVQALVEPHGFSKRKAVFYRIKNDVAQGFEFEEKRTRTHLFFTISFGVQALCNPDARLFQLAFDSRDIGYLMPHHMRWPFFILRNHSDEIPNCTEQVCRTIEKYLIPYFDFYCSCAQANHGLPELDGFNGADLNAAHFALRCDNRQKALACITALLQQRQWAKIQNFPDEQCDKLDEIDRALQTKYDFIANAKDHEIQAYIQENELRAREFLQG